MRSTETLSDEAKQKEVARALVSIVFLLTQPGKGDVFGWVDENADEIAAHIVQSVKGL